MKPTAPFAAETKLKLEPHQSPKMSKETLNEKPFSYHSSWGSSFKCDRCDFRSPVTVHMVRQPKTEIELKFFARDVAEMVAYHAMNIWPKLNGFQNYDSIAFEFRK